MSEYSQEILDSLTDEEREALNEDDGGGTDAKGDAGGDDNAGGDKGSDDGKGQQGDKSGQDGKTAGADGSDGKADDSAGKADGAGNSDGADNGEQSASDASDGAAAAKEPIVPLLVAEAPADAEAKLKDIGDKKATLVDQFDNGDITAKEYQTQLDALNKDERALERAIDKAQTAAEMKQQQEVGSWLKQVNEFTTKDFPEYGKSRSRWMALDTFVKEIAAKPENANLDGREILRQAHERVVDDLGEAAKPAADTKKDGKPLKGAEIKPPKTLGKVPAADNQEIDDGKFSALDRLADSDPLALEEKLFKMSPADRDEYLASRG